MVAATWNYTANHMVTQDEIDNNGVIDPAPTISNTVSADSNQTNPESASASVLVEQRSDLSISYTADLPPVDSTLFPYTSLFRSANAGNMSLTNLVVSDTFASNLAAVDA